MMIWWWEHSEKGVSDRQTYWRTSTDNRIDRSVLRAAWSQLIMHCRILAMMCNFISKTCLSSRQYHNPLNSIRQFSTLVRGFPFIKGVSIWGDCLTNIRIIPVIKIRWYPDHVIFVMEIPKYYRFSIYLGYIWYDSAHGTTIIMIELCTHKRHLIPRPYGWAMGCLLWFIQGKMTTIYQECTVPGKTVFILKQGLHAVLEINLRFAPSSSCGLYAQAQWFVWFGSWGPSQ